MSQSIPETGLQLRTLVKESGELELSLIDAPVPQPGDDDVLIRVEATPINPSDLGLLVGAADLSTARASGSDSHPVITADIPKPAMRAMAARVGQSLVLEYFDEAGDGHYPMTVEIVGEGSLYDSENQRVRG